MAQPTRFSAPVFEVPTLMKRQISEEYGLCALIGRNNLPTKLKRELGEFTNWCTDKIRLDRGAPTDPPPLYDSVSKYGPTDEASAKFTLVELTLI